MSIWEMMEEEDCQEEDQEDKEQRIRENIQNGTHNHIGGGYCGYHGSVDEQPDNPQGICDDD